MHADALRAQKYWLPPPDRSCSQWAEDCRVLSNKASASPGPWRNARTPYSVGIMDASTDPRVRKIILVSGVQMLKTEPMFNMHGCQVEDAPGPTLFVLPNDDVIKKISRRITLMYRDSPTLTALIAKEKSRSSENSMYHKEFLGGNIDFASANSPRSMASDAKRYLYGDEVDGWPVSSGKEGDPLGIAIGRTVTYDNLEISLQVLCSTPLLKGVSIIEREYNASDQRKLYLRCPKCGGPQVLMFKHMKFDIVKDKVSDNRIARNVVYECQSCGCDIRPSEKFEMLANHEWVAQTEFNGTAGFWANGLNSAFISWENFTNAFLAAKDGGMATFQPFVNTMFAKSWAPPGASVDPESLQSRCSPYYINTPEGRKETTRPDGVKIITVGADVHKRNIMYSVWGWGRNYERWLLEYGILPGDPTQKFIWDVHRGILSKSWRGMKASYLFQDCKFLAPYVHTFTRGTAGAYSASGEPKAQPLWQRHIMQSKTKGLRKLYRVDVHSIKKSLQNALQMQTPGAAHYVHFPEDVEKEFFNQLTAEVLRMPLDKNGYSTEKWEKQGGRENHYGDTAVYAEAALGLLPSPDINVVIDVMEKNQKQAQAQAASPKRRPYENFLGNARKDFHS